MQDGTWQINRATVESFLAWHHSSLEQGGFAEKASKRLNVEGN